jgi:hypothetical protein
VPTGTTSNYWRTRQSLLDALIDRVVELAVARHAARAAISVGAEDLPR